MISTELLHQLFAAVAPLENVPDEQKDWHPGSNEQVLDLVHPSLFPIVYNRSLRRLNGLGSTEVMKPPVNKFYAISQMFQWLPSDFAVSDQGEVTLLSPYINNVHPTHHAKLYDVLPKIVERAIPLFERVLSDLRRPLLPWRIASERQTPRFPTYTDESACCIWPGDPQIPDEEEEDEFNENPDAWYAKYPKILPQVKGPYEGDLKLIEKTVSLNGTTIQCIIKLANIVLTPEKPEYPGGRWHVEGTFTIPVVQILNRTIFLRNDERAYCI